jgi:hypothetical protein
VLGISIQSIDLQENHEPWAVATRQGKRLCSGKSETDAIRLVADAIRTFALTTLKDECLLMESNEKPGYFQVEVREHHTRACGGNPETEPRLFGVRVMKHDGRLTSDVYDGVRYQPVDRQPGKR